MARTGRGRTAAGPVLAVTTRSPATAHSEHLVVALAGVVERMVGLERVTGPVAVACSGGPDSVALLALALARGLEPVMVHVDHGLRPESDEDAVRAVALADRLGAPSVVMRVAVGPGGNVEARARDARYAALRAACRDAGASAILLGHTADDQAETVLVNLLRGSASAGLAAMPVWRDDLVRPLLRLRRSDTERVCSDLGLEPVRDASNEDRSLLRNWIRHEMLPAACRASKRDLVTVLARQADVLRAESEYLDGLASAAWPPDAASAPAAHLARLPSVLARRAVRRWLGLPPPSFDEVDRVLSVARGDVRATQLAGGRRVWRTGGQMFVDSGSVAR